MRKLPEIEVSATFCIFLAVSLLLLPLQWVLATIVAACFHEVCHIFAIRMLGGRLSNISAGINGATIGIAAMSESKECLCALAGPIGGLILLIFARWIPKIAVCAAIQSLYNLLPLYPLDGGRALRCIAQRFMPGYAEKLCVWIENFCLIGITLISLYACFFLKLGILPLFFAGLLWHKTKNTPCKAPVLKVQ